MSDQRFKEVQQKVRRRNQRRQLMTAVFPLMIAAGMILNLINVVSAVREAGMSFGDFLMVSDFGWLVLTWANNPVLVVAALTLFIVGFFGTASRLR